MHSNLIRAFALLAVLGCGIAQAQTDPLPSWNPGAAKQAIVDFVGRVTRPGGTEFVPPAERIATFDNDGTLWAEQPIYFQFAFAMDRVKALAPKHPEWKTQEPYKFLLANDTDSVLAGGEKALLPIIMTTHAGMTTQEFSATVIDWTTTARHPRFKRPYTDLTYLPMQELLRYLRANGFKTFIVSGGGVEFMRAWAEKTYGIPPEQVVGSSGEIKLLTGDDGKLVLQKLPRVEFIDDGPGKVLGINRFIGRRPIFAFGNSDGDLQMLQWTSQGSGAHFAGIVRHTDAVREWAYDRTSHIGKLDKALDVALDEGKAKGWTVVDMKSDWKKVFAFE